MVSKLLLFAVGAVLGAASIVFFLQNATLITVSFMWWSVTASVALMAFSALFLGILTLALLLALNNVARYGLNVKLFKGQRKLEGETTQLQYATNTNA